MHAKLYDSNEGDLTFPNLFLQGFRIKSTVCIEVLEINTKPYINSVRDTNPYWFQENSTPPHKAKVTQGMNDWTFS